MRRFTWTLVLSSVLGQASLTLGCPGGGGESQGGGGTNTSSATTAVSGLWTGGVMAPAAVQQSYSQQLAYRLQLQRQNFQQQALQQMAYQQFLQRQYLEQQAIQQSLAIEEYLQQERERKIARRAEREAARLARQEAVRARNIARQSLKRQSEETQMAAGR